MNKNLIKCFVMLLAVAMFATITLVTGHLCLHLHHQIAGTSEHAEPGSCPCHGCATQPENPCTCTCKVLHLDTQMGVLDRTTLPRYSRNALIMALSLDSPAPACSIVMEHAFLVRKADLPVTGALAAPYIQVLLL